MANIQETIKIDASDITNIADKLKSAFRKVFIRHPQKVIFNNPATIVYWDDGTKTVVKCCKGDKYDKEKGLAMAMLKGLYGDDFKKIFKEFCPDEHNNIGLDINKNDTITFAVNSTDGFAKAFKLEEM